MELLVISPPRPITPGKRDDRVSEAPQRAGTRLSHPPREAARASLHCTSAALPCLAGATLRARGYRGSAQPQGERKPDPAQPVPRVNWRHQAGGGLSWWPDATARLRPADREGKATRSKPARPRVRFALAPTLTTRQGGEGRHLRGAPVVKSRKGGPPCGLPGLDGLVHGVPWLLRGGEHEGRGHAS